MVFELLGRHGEIPGGILEVASEIRRKEAKEGFKHNLKNSKKILLEIHLGFAYREVITIYIYLYTLLFCISNCPKIVKVKYNSSS